ncbi:E3 ubiquitin-protein ligase RING1 [Amborella trichopoda]|uniref:RING-type E3 ubiquitin transferase n=1 Tax=Amborella trichopoda TaxID=13333 RepID=W1NJG4_AMBTC|nr:E3 ubiquitin-protein ligase RING1 [Amborella trichopoda]ERM95369.1 hypothetical protein AMTR_s00008p00200880 [Amborella trichopoda]|eukprot:XP_006827953.1 E3 ubiquitin-protein ligase RING1 [Amborella trichopoda]
MALFTTKWVESLDCLKTAICYGDESCIHDHCFYPPPPPPPPPPLSESHPSTTPSTLVIAIVTLLTSAFLLITYYAIFVKYCSFRNSRNSNQPHDHHENNDQENNQNQNQNQEPPIHHIWYITTVGLEESLIKSITVCKYKGGDGLIEGADCSVCLSEFNEGEEVRLLPKCSHAFHLPCIDTWLRSHTNCPLCRAPIVSNSDAPTSQDQNGDGVLVSGEISQQNESYVVVPSGGSEGSSSVGAGTEDERERGKVGESVAERGRDMTKVGESGAERGRDMTKVGNLERERRGGMGKAGNSNVSCGFYVLRHLGSAHRLGESMREVKAEAPQAMRRSFSMDFPNGICLSSSDDGGKNQRNGKLLRDGSEALSFQKGPVAVIRSFSSGKFGFSRHSRGRSSVLPL